MSTSEAHRLMAKGLTYQANGEIKKLELNRQIVAVNNFLWRTDQLIARREHVAAAKMLQKATGVASRMENPVEDIVRELRIRKKLLDEREFIMPLLRLDMPPPANDFRLEVMDFDSYGIRFHDELECLNYVRAEIFHEAHGVPLNSEMDERDELSRHFVLHLGDAIVAGARVWAQDKSSFVLDRIFVAPEYRGRRLATRLLEAALQDCGRAGARLLIAIRNDSPESESQRTRIRLRDRLIASGRYRIANPNLFLPHVGVAGQFGAGVFVTLLEPL